VLMTSKSPFTSLFGRIHVSFSDILRLKMGKSKSKCRSRIVDEAPCPRQGYRSRRDTDELVSRW
jgi:hypothetical protein